MSTVKLSDDLYREFEKLAARSRRTVDDVVADVLRAALPTRHTEAPSKRVELPTFRGTGLRPGVSLDNSAELLDVMESGE